MQRPGYRVRTANPNDVESVFALASEFATSFMPQRATFGSSFSRLIVNDDAALLVAEGQGELVGYLLGFDRDTLFANGRVSWVEEVAVRPDLRRQGIGSILMGEFEQWTRCRGSRLVALATRRAADFYRALGYEESAAYLRKLL